jgi:hypothetical protein
VNVVATPDGMVLVDWAGARSRPLILRAWSVCMGRATPTQAMTAASETKALTEMIATRVRASVTGR